MTYVAPATLFDLCNHALLAEGGNGLLSTPVLVTNTRFFNRERSSFAPAAAECKLQKACLQPTGHFTKHTVHHSAVGQSKRRRSYPSMERGAYSST